MAVTAVGEKAPRGVAEDELTDEQIDALLARATARLQEKAKANELLRLDNTQKYIFPRLQTGKLDEPYITSNGAVATADASRLLDAKQRKQADDVRKVQDPIIAKKLAQEVRSPIQYTMANVAMRKTIPKTLEQSPGTVLACRSAQLREFQTYS